MQAASRATLELRRDYPGLTAKEFAGWFPYARAADGELVTDALQRAGWH